MRGSWVFMLAAVMLLSGCIGQQPQQTQQVIIIDDKPVLRAELADCAFEGYAKGASRYMFFFKVINTGENPTKVPAQVCMSNSLSKRTNCIELTRQYYGGQVLWDDIDWTDGRHGQRWYIEAPAAQRQDMNVRLYYTGNIYYTESPTEPANDTIILYEGSTAGCRTESH
jgi:hypothetical protein